MGSRLGRADIFVNTLKPSMPDFVEPTEIRRLNGHLPQQERQSSAAKAAPYLAGESITMRDINESICTGRVGISTFHSMVGQEEDGLVHSGMDNSFGVHSGSSGINLTVNNSTRNVNNHHSSELESSKKKQLDGSGCQYSRRHKRKQDLEDIQRVDSTDHLNGQRTHVEEVQHISNDILDVRETGKCHSPKQLKRKPEGTTDTVGLRAALSTGLQNGSGNERAGGGTMKTVQPGDLKKNAALQSQGMYSMVSSEEEVGTVMPKTRKDVDVHPVPGIVGTFLCDSCEHGLKEDGKLTKLEEAFSREQLENEKLKEEVEAMRRQMDILIDVVEQGKETCKHCQLIKQQLSTTLARRVNKKAHDSQPSGPCGTCLPPSAQVSSAKNTGSQSPVGSCASEWETQSIGDPSCDKNEDSSDRKENCKSLAECETPVRKNLNVDYDLGSDVECQLWVDLVPQADDEDIDIIKEEGTKLGSSLLIEEYVSGRHPSANGSKDSSQTLKREKKKRKSSLLRERALETKDPNMTEDSAVVRTLLLFGQTILEKCPLTPERNSKLEDLQPQSEEIQGRSSTKDVDKIFEEFEDTGEHKGSPVIEKHDECRFSLKTHSIGSGVDKQGEECVPFIDLECGCTSQRHGDTIGILRLYRSGMLEVYCQCCSGCGKGKPMTPAHFEKHAGRAASKKWKESIWVVLGERKVPFSRIKGLDAFCRRYKVANRLKSHQSSVVKQAHHRHEFVRCKKCRKERRFRRRNKEECRLFHEASLYSEWECSNFPYDRLSCQDDEEREVRRAIRGCTRSRTCQGCIQCVCVGCFTCRFTDCSCRICKEFVANNKE